MSANSSPAEVFRKLARNVAERAGSSWAFLFTLAIVIVWVCVGPYFRFSDPWQLVINTGSSIVTFLKVFLIQNTQNRDCQPIGNRFVNRSLWWPVEGDLRNGGGPFWPRGKLNT